MVADITLAIEKLYKREKYSLNDISNVGFETSENTTEKYRSLVKFARRCFAHSTEPFESGVIKSWSGSISQTPIPVSMFLQPTIIVDVLPESEANFIQRNGVTVDQFCRLASEGIVIPNLAYDSQIEDFYGNQKDISKSDYANYPYLTRIFDPDLTPSTINGIRRAAVFTGMGFNRDWRGTHIKQADEIIQKLVENYTVDELYKYQKGMLALKQSDTSIIIANNMMYLEAFGGFFGITEDQAWIYDFIRDPKIG